MSDKYYNLTLLQALALGLILCTGAVLGIMSVFLAPSMSLLAHITSSVVGISVGTLFYHFVLGPIGNKVYEKFNKPEETKNG